MEAIDVKLMVRVPLENDEGDQSKYQHLLFMEDVFDKDKITS